MNLRSGKQEVTGDHRPAGAAAGAYRQREIRPAPYPGISGQHLIASTGGPWLPGGMHARFRRDRSGAEPVAALATTGCQHGAAGPGPHAQPEAMGLRPPTIVRLERPLTH
jgi:hypothetical protein